MRVALTEKIEWIDGAVLKVRRLTKEQKDSISEKVSKSIVQNLEDAKIEEAARIELAGKYKELKITPDKESKKRIQEEINILSAIANRTSRAIQSKVGLAAMEASICGWENILDENGKEVEFNEDNLSTLWNMASQDEDVLDKLIIFHRGPLGN